MKQTYQCTILERAKLSDKTISLLIDASQIREEILPGQFFHINCNTQDSYLRRPISVCDFEKGRLRLVFEIRGKGTAKLAKLNKGDAIDLLGPLGRGFHLPKSGKRAAVVGGGIGTFPLLFLTKSLSFPCDAFLGFRCEEQIILADEFKSLPNVNLILCTDNGSCGYCGFAPSALTEALDAGKNYDIIYTCGPRIMMDCVAKTATEKKIPCQLSLEERMGCGIGACLVCACQTKEKNGQSHMSRVCADGPVFWAEEIL
ncbi:MAG: dihydroorotate dehydrogenase electron transfer subunit [Clostridiales bacterium]|nr:dihydroorotate dehydrogenase electron transfer subunit [Clostridiales bacterium]